MGDTVRAMERSVRDLVGETDVETLSAGEVLDAALDRLPARYGDVLEWKYIEGRSVEEISELLGVGQVAAQSVLARARTSFREALETVFGSTAQDILGTLRGK